MENEAKKTKPTDEDTDKGNKLSTDEQIKRSNEAAERLEAANREAALSGEAEGGIVAKKPTDKDKYEADAKERYAGTGLDPTEDESPTTYG